MQSIIIIKLWFWSTNTLNRNAKGGKAEFLIAQIAQFALIANDCR
jgi:hypothetical protein